MLDLRLWQYLLIELAMLSTAFASTYVRPLQTAVRAVERVLERLARRPVTCFVTVFAFAIVLRLVCLPFQPIPKPLFHDEFSYLLGADTFAHGRLTNPVPPVPIAFETIHILTQPSYTSMYMPGVALILSFGQLLGSPWISVLLIKALLSGTMYWMVSGWLPKTYALALSFVAIGLTGSMNWWWDSYFCIALSSLGTALVLGSIPRIARMKSRSAAAMLGAGLAILILTRPYEGCMLTLPAVLALLWSLRRDSWRSTTPLALVSCTVVAASGAWLLFYNHQVSGHMLLFPYALDFVRYHITGPFLFSARRPLPSYDLDILRRFYIFAELPQYAFIHQHPWMALAKKVNVYYSTIALGFAVPIVFGLLYLIRKRQIDPLYLTPCVSFLGFAINVILMGWSPFPQYSAPALPLMLLLLGFGMYGLRTSGSTTARGVSLARGLVVVELMLTLSVFGFNAVDNRNIPEPHYVSIDREAVDRLVRSQPGKQLCFVRYTPFHESWQEWIFNGADLQSEKVLWARSLDAETDKAVLRAFPDRKVWLVEPDFAGRLIQPYSSQAPYLGGR